MDGFQAWALSHWITFSAAALLAINVVLALASQRRFVIFGAVALLCFWVMTIAIVLLMRDKDSTGWRLIIDLAATLLFYRLAERDRRTGERHDWAALICFCYVWLIFIDLRTLLLGNPSGNFFVAMSNVIFVVKILVNLAPSISTIAGGKPILIAGSK